jgi:hypothetical protein
MRHALPAVIATALLATPSGPVVAAVAAGGCGSAVGQRRVAAALATARARYSREATGVAAHTALRKVAADRVLADDVGAGRLGAATSEALRLVSGHQHITAIRVVSGSRVLVDTKRYLFDVAGPQTALRDRRGAVVGTLEVTIQDVIGFIRLVHKYTGAVVVVRGAAGEVKSSLTAARGAVLPSAGCVTVAGRSYAVRSFVTAAFGGERLTVWVLRSS